MSIAAAYLVSDGVVFGADSYTTVHRPGPSGLLEVVQLLTHSQKVFEVGEKSRVGICTWGDAGIGKFSHRTIISRLSDTIKKDTTLQEAANKLLEIVKPIAQSEEIRFAGYFLGGWDVQTKEPGCYRIEITKDQHVVTPLTIGLCSFAGNPKYFSRVFYGYDPALRDKLKMELMESLSFSPDSFEAIFDDAFQKAASGLTAIGFNDLPIREAIDFIYSYLHITIKAEKFSYGHPSCGGPIEIGFITTDSYFRWVKHKPFFSAIAEQEGEYNVK
jgi:hypothetical protein